MDAKVVLWILPSNMLKITELLLNPNTHTQEDKVNVDLIQEPSKSEVTEMLQEEASVN
jgi:hypothetical protein